MPYPVPGMTRTLSPSPSLPSGSRPHHHPDLHHHHHHQYIPGNLSHSSPQDLSSPLISSHHYDLASASSLSPSSSSSSRSGRRFSCTFPSLPPPPPASSCSPIPLSRLLMSLKRRQGSYPGLSFGVTTLLVSLLVLPTASNVLESGFSLAHPPDVLNRAINSTRGTDLTSTTDPILSSGGGLIDESVSPDHHLPLPVWLHICLICTLLVLSGLFSGLNLGLMALDQNDLKVIASCGTKKEKQYAAAISPIRARGNFLLCALLLGNVLVNTTLTTLLDALTGSGALAVVSATLSIVVFGEILPQAVCSRHGLAVGANTIAITYAFMAITSPLAYPISLLLDKILGEEIGCVYNREQLAEYIRITRDYNRLEDNEVGIITGALALRSKVARDCHTPLHQVFMLPLESKLNYETISLLNAKGFSRIPVYAEGDVENVIGLLHSRDLALIDPSGEGADLKDVLDYYKHPLFSVYQDTPLDCILAEFKMGKSHMALVRSVQTKVNRKKWIKDTILTMNVGEKDHSSPQGLGGGGGGGGGGTDGDVGDRDVNQDCQIPLQNQDQDTQDEQGDGDDDEEEEEGDPYYKLEGIITLEDIIEEILGSEIVDESDVLAAKLVDKIRETNQGGGGGKKGSTMSSHGFPFLRQSKHCDACCKCTCDRKKKLSIALMEGTVSTHVTNVTNPHPATPLSRHPSSPSPSISH